MGHGELAVLSSKSTSQASIQRREGDPQAELLAWLGGATAGDLLLVEFSLAQWWLQRAPSRELLAIYSKQSTGSYRCAVTEAVDLDVGELAQQGLPDWAAAHSVPVFEPGKPLLLPPTCIPKPWGQEIWFTGVEERGVCCFSDGTHGTPIPWLQTAMPAAGKAGQPLVLLKILDPAPVEVTGDLYFELHQEKREVYVVTNVDSRAWPDGVGGIRYGFDPVQVEAAGSDTAFRQRYLDSVRDYEAVRREIDDLPEGQEVGAELQSREVDLRSRMNRFTLMRDLRVGDVVVVPLLMPHSLQHGVRTIEFQTPVYERKILSFAQKVLTQGHWDTAEAVEQMRLTPPATDDFQLLPSVAGAVAERIVDFPDFEVRRLRLNPGVRVELPPLECYQLLMVVEGELPLESANLGPEQAAFLPAGESFTLAHRATSEPLVVLLAQPRV